MPNRKRMREPVIPELDAETFLLWESKRHERHERHHGFVVAFARGTVDNDRIAHNLRTAFDALFPPPCRSHGSDVKVQIDASTVYSPDATVVDQPRVVAEVLSPSTRAYDIIGKRAMYRNVPSLVVRATDAGRRRQATASRSHSGWARSRLKPRTHELRSLPRSRKNTSAQKTIRGFGDV